MNDFEIVKWYIYLMNNCIDKNWYFVLIKKSNKNVFCFVILECFVKEIYNEYEIYVILGFFLV